MPTIPNKEEKIQDVKCLHCKFLSETFCNNKEKNDREYWQMTEVFVYLHGSDVCNFAENSNAS